MKKSMYVMGSVEALLGSLILCVTSVIKEVIPMLGRIAFQRAMAGSYSPRDYRVYFSLATTVAVFLILVGIGQIIYSCFKKN